MGKKTVAEQVHVLDHSLSRPHGEDGQDERGAEVVPHPLCPPRPP